MNIAFQKGRTSLCDDERSVSLSMLTNESSVQVVERTVMKGMNGIQLRFQIFRKLKVYHCPPFLLGADRHWSCHIERSATFKRLRRMMSDTLFRSVVDYSSFTNGYEANSQVYVETPLHPEKLTVWCALWAGGIIGPYFFKSDEGHNVTINGDWYRAMITNFFIPELNNHDVQELWFQQDGATCHTARVTINLLKDTFGDRLISRFGPVNWPPRSCDLRPIDCFLWSYKVIGLCG
ncbi:uncharacterized protein TNCV_2837271 [Trichonephila clavipes]|nr:uncharacterized protein TNCV_2837271 [Trichonephila clavipes]